MTPTPGAVGTGEAEAIRPSIDSIAVGANSPSSASCRGRASGSFSTPSDSSPTGSRGRNGAETSRNTWPDGVRTLNRGEKPWLSR